MIEIEKCCDNCDFYEGAICHIWTNGDTECIEDIAFPEVQVCKCWEGEE